MYLVRAMTDNAITKAVRKAGGQTHVARQFGLTRQAVESWFANGVPAKHVLKLARLSGVPAWELAPEIYPPPDGGDPNSPDAYPGGLQVA